MIKMKKTQSISNAEYKEDSSFGKRLDFTIPTKEQRCDKAVDINDRAFRKFNEDIKVAAMSASYDVLKKRQIEFNGKLRKNPKDVPLWLEFVQFQVELFKVEKKRKMIDRKISILKKAIEFNSEALELIFMRLELSEEIENSTILMKIWEKYLKNYEGEIYWKISMKYLEFRRKRFLSFSYDQVNEAFVTTFEKYKTAPVKVLLEFYAEYFNFLKKCGYNEIMVAIIQALIETNIEQFNYKTVDLEAYEDQWDFGLMEHIGDIRQGKKTFDFDLTRSSLSVYLDSNSMRQSQSSSSSIFLKWLENEKRCEKVFWHPKHFESDEQVVFEDIKNLIIIVKDRGDILDFIKGILVLADTNNEEQVSFYSEVYRVLLPFYKKDWEFICKAFQLLHRTDPDEAESFGKRHLSENRDSFESFLAFGRFQELTGNAQISLKIYESIQKRTKQFDQIIKQFQTEKKKEEDKEDYYCFINANDLLNSEDLKAEVYDLIRRNPGDKSLYMRIIESIVEIDPELAMEVFNLINEQELKLYNFLEEENKS